MAITIKRIKLVTPVPVYDITVPATQSFFANGIVVHNCSEYVHIPYTSCNLGSLNVLHFVLPDGCFDWDRFEIEVERVTVYLNGIIDQNDYPLEKIRQETMNVRPIGLGLMGVAHAMMAMGISYASAAGQKFAGNLTRFATLVGMRKSCELARLNGKSYPYYDHATYMDANKRFFTEDVFMGIEVAQLAEDIKTYGIYNSCITSIAPTGTISYIADCSSGIEPVFGLVFTRKIEKENKTYEHVFLVDPIFEHYVLKNHSAKKEKIYEYVAGNKGSCQGCPDLPKKAQEVFVVAGDLTPDEHLQVLAVVANNTSLSVSKTINLPADCSEAELGEVFKKAHKLGIIGVTVYRDGSREGILVHDSKPEDNQALKFTPAKNRAPKRPESLMAELHHFTVDGKKHYAAIGMLNDYPFEIFTGVNEIRGKEYIPKQTEPGHIIRHSKRRYEFVDSNFKSYDLTNGHSNDTSDALSRLVSMGLRHGVDITFIVEQLNKTTGSIVSYSKVLARTLKKYVPEGATSGEECVCGTKMIYGEGCKKCPACGNSKCG